MFTGMNDRDDLERQKMNDWLAGSGATVAVVVVAIMVAALVWQIVAEFLR